MAIANPIQPNGSQLFPPNAARSDDYLRISDLTDVQ
jgi:hypothetical protein